MNDLIEVSNSWVTRRPKSKQSAMLENVQTLLISECNVNGESIIHLSEETIYECLNIMKPSGYDKFVSTLLNSVDAEYEIDGEIIKPVLSVSKTSNGFQIELNSNIIRHWYNPFPN